MAWGSLPTKELHYNVDDGAAAPTDVATVDCWITRVWVSNNSGASRTVVIVDKADTPRTLMTVTLDGTTQLVWHTELKLHTALFCEGGLAITPSGSDVYVSILGRRRGV